MPRSDWFRPTFRVKILLALVGTVAPLLLVTLLVVRREANRQVDAVVQTTVDRAGDAFARIERIRQQQLDQLGHRAANSNRWGAALQQALEGDTPYLIEMASYELKIAGFPQALAAFTSLGAEPVAALVNDVPLADPAVAISTPAIDRLFAGDTAVFGYHLIGRQLFSIHPTVLTLVEQPIGILMLGLAIDDETAHSLAQALGADVCFEVNQQCVATSGATHQSKLFRQVERPLPGGTETGAQFVLNIPLDEVVRPFAKIQKAISYIGFAVLALAILVAWVLSRGFARPVLALVAATARVARGDYETHVSVRTKDEIGQLADAFNEMTRGLLLKEKYKGVLDKVVSRDVADEMLKGEIKLGGETREVTTLFADIRGFTAMAEHMPPQEVVGLLNEVMERAEAAIVAEGGVVDKYVGDEIMALFGAPMSYGDDALRAVRAAVRIQGEAAGINERRPADAEPIAMGIGINTGDVVAGNMGSARRLNYTVLGAPVNLAARLCAAAARGQILVSETTLERVRDHVHVASLGTRSMKGISVPVEVFEVIAVEADTAAATSSFRTTLGLIAVLLLAPPSASAQRVVTLGPVQIAPSARLDLQGFAPDDMRAGLIDDTAPFIAGSATATLDIFAGRRIYGMLELRADRGEAPSSGDLQFRIEQAFLRLTPIIGTDLSVQAGRFVSPFGNYPQRHHSAQDPLIRPPLSYDYRTTLCPEFPPGSNNAFIGWKDQPNVCRPTGAPPVWAAPYQLGALLVGSVGRVSYRLAAMNGAPSAAPDVWNQWPESADLLSYIAHLGVQLSPEIRVGASFDRGPYLHPNAATALPAGRTIADYDQSLIGFETTITRGFLELRGEVIRDTWQVPRVADDAIDLSWYAEGKLKLRPGLHAAARYGSIHFNDVHADDGSTSPWGHATRRLQVGAGYRVTESLDVRAEIMLNHSAGPADPADNLFAIQASWLIR